MNNHEKIQKIIKYLKITGIIIIILLIIVGIFLIYNKNVEKTAIKNNEVKLENYLKSIGYSYNDNSFYKEIKDSNNNTTTITTYVYNVNVNKLSKTVKINSKNSQEQLILRYNGSNEISVSYSYSDYSDINKDTYIEQESNYIMDNGSFDCNIIMYEGNYPSQCKKMKDESEKFINEVNEILEKANIDKNHTIKNSKKW